MSPRVVYTRSAPSLAASRRSIAAERSIPWTSSPRSASGSPMRPVPIANSSTGPPAARPASRSTIGPTTSGAQFGSSWYVAAIASSKCPSSIPKAYSTRTPVLCFHPRSGHNTRLP